MTRPKDTDVVYVDNKLKPLEYEGVKLMRYVCSVCVCVLYSAYTLKMYVMYMHIHLNYMF